MTLSTRCPACQSLDVASNPGASSTSYVCRNCDARFRLEDERTVLEARPAGGAGRALGFVVLGALAVAGGYYAYNARGAAEAPVAAAPKAEAVATPGAPAGAASAEIADLREGTTALGGRYWLMTYKNTGPVAIERPSVVVKLSDAAGKPLGEETGSGTRDLLAPGESMPCFVLKNDAPKGAKAEVTVTPPQAATRDPWKRPLQVVGVVHKKQPLGATAVVGEVVNDTKGGARFIEVIVVGVDAAGHPVSWGTGMPMTEALPPGGRSPFQVRMGTFEVEPPVDYQGFALGNVR